MKLSDNPNSGRFNHRFSKYNFKYQRNRLTYRCFINTIKRWVRVVIPVSLYMPIFLSPFYHCHLATCGHSSDELNWLFRLYLQRTVHLGPGEDGFASFQLILIRLFEVFLKIKSKGVLKNQSNRIQIAFLTREFRAHQSTFRHSMPKYNKHNAQHNDKLHF